MSRIFLENFRHVTPATGPTSNIVAPLGRRFAERPASAGVLGTRCGASEHSRAHPIEAHVSSTPFPQRSCLAPLGRKGSAHRLRQSMLRSPPSRAGSLRRHPWPAAYLMSLLQVGAGGRNRTAVWTLEGSRSAVELRPRRTLRVLPKGRTYGSSLSIPFSLSPFDTS